jgi:bacillithiol biosynthesis cysteine-adding enzyme BshC
VPTVSSALVITESLGGSPLAMAAARGVAPADWYVAIPKGRAEWERRARAVMATADRGWLDALRPAFDASGQAAVRLEAVAQGRGIVVTTGQQPGLFGGPIYTWSKALSAIALADALEASTGIPAAPVFWAATDDSDFAEASWTMVARPGGVDELRLPGDVTGLAMADVPLGDVSALLESFERAAGSAAWAEPLRFVRQAYRGDQSVGSAYLELLRAMLEPLGMPVLDAAHPSVRTAGSSLMREALRRSERVAGAIAERDRALLDAGHSAQVASVAGLSLVFRADGGERQRIKHADARSVADAAKGDALSPNVLLRPVVERAILPTAAYVAGPAEIAYFAQVSAVAAALDAAVPLAVPRWSCTILEPNVAEILERHGLRADELRDPHAAETRLARERLPEGVSAAFASMTTALREGLEALERSGPDLVAPAAGEGARRSIAARLSRLERRYTAAVKRRIGDVLHDIATARSSLFPRGKRQERALNLIPLLARHGQPLWEAMQDAARAHARGLIDGAEEARPRSERQEQPTSSA